MELLEACKLSKQRDEVFPVRNWNSIHEIYTTRTFILVLRAGSRIVKLRLIANLFADDATTFLDAEDGFQDLIKILDDWCLASGACFNVGKTQIMPMGSSEFHTSFTDNRRSRDRFDKIPENIHIVQEGEAIRILGAWFGNNIPDDTA
ncbi:uncharacterized protein BT62DRAFT_1039481 [Guyanagaster necrorhizus]|uniref:Uncharacterized protein n=1 Tax=Guyanagaster necrorhizus TaxID=856835 RepID=A0A9P7W2W8_9AGAR|nr:uncharacterized protein BT62DRAFT_1039481 [Guyanagaster necrorhizus MCA 3950]KAG7451420.1 hypothetical protein BT62DRAFT_1039481 [Guyanagaster necrorhizus MCA 3950]